MTVGRVFVCGKQTLMSWEFVGVFTTRVAAIKACITPEHFIAPTFINRVCHPRKSISWPGLVHPMRDAE